MTETDSIPSAGYPVRGSMMCVYVFPPATKNFSVEPDVDMDSFFR